MRTTRALLAGLGTTGTLVAAAACLFLVASAIVAFKGWPGGGIADRIESLFVNDQPRASRERTGTPAGAAAAAPAGAGVAGAPAGSVATPPAGVDLTGVARLGGPDTDVGSGPIDGVELVPGDDPGGATFVPESGSGTAPGPGPAVLDLGGLPGPATPPVDDPTNGAGPTLVDTVSGVSPTLAQTIIEEVANQIAGSVPGVGGP